MSADKYLLKKYSLKFRDKETEKLYIDFILERTLLFCRITWIIVILLGGSFGFLDRHIFGENSDIVLFMRIILLLIATLAFSSTFSVRIKRFLELSSSLFILMIGLFCIFLISFSDRTAFTPYFTGLFFAFTGVFITAGLGFRFSFFALLVILAAFEIVFGIMTPVPALLFMVYNFFLIGMMLIFIYIGYLVEKISRKNFTVSARLSDMLAEVRQLSGLLPICASCKKIRDDKGYWNQIEEYFTEHTDAIFSHGICPECAKKLYPDIELQASNRKIPTSYIEN